MSRVAALAALLAALAPVGVAHAQSTATHALVVAGQARAPDGASIFACGTSGPQPRESQFFNRGVALPIEGYAYCNLSGGIQATVNPVGPSSSHRDVTLPFNNGVATLSADAVARFDSVGVQSLGSFTGFGDSWSYSAVEAAAYVQDGLTLEGSGDAFLRFTFTVDGSGFTTGNSQIQTLLNYRLGGGPIYTAFSAGAFGGGAYADGPATPGGPALSGFTLSGGSFSGADDVLTFLLPITRGVLTGWRWGMYVASYPQPFTGVANNDFLSTARLSGIEAFDAQGRPFDFTITSLSGTIYDATGAHVPGAVPEPANWAMLIVGFGAVGFAGRIRRRRTMLA